MALDAGEVAVTIEYAMNLKDKDIFGKQDPYCIIKVGSQNFRTRTAKDGGKRPVWNETFRFNVINENDAELIIKDDDVGRDDNIGTARVSLAKAREHGRDQIQAPVVSKSGKQHGFVQVSLVFTRNASLKNPYGGYGASPYPPQQQAQYGYPQQIPGYGGPPPAYPPAYGAPPPPYGAPPAGYGAPAPAYGAPPGGGYPPAAGIPYPPPGGAGYPATAPQQGYPPQAPAQGYPSGPPAPYGAPPPGQYGAPPPGQYGAPPPGQYGAPPSYGAPGYPTYR